jgi:hypothetical protein
MAKLREQRWMVKKLNNFFKDTGYSSPSSYSIRLRNIAEDAIPENDFSGMVATHVTLHDRLTHFFRKNYYSGPKYQLHRSNRNNRIYKTCLDDGFIEHVIVEVHDPQRNLNIQVHKGIRVSTKGTDLIQPFGFSELTLKKYPTGRLIVTTVITTVFSTTVLGTVIIYCLKLL